jgi:hypothetical protein
VFAGLAGFVAQARLGVGALPLGQTKVDQDAVLGRRVVEKVGGLDVAVQDLVLVHALERQEQGPQVDGNVRYRHVTEVASKVPVSEIGQDGDDLVGVSKGRDERTDRGALAQVVQQLELVEDARRAGCDIDLLDGDETRPATRRALR